VTKEQQSADQPKRHQRKRQGGRSANTRRSAPAVRQPPWTLPKITDSPIEPLDETAVQRIHDAAMRVLEDIGIVFLCDEAISILKMSGCDVDVSTGNVRMGRDFVMEQVRKAPAEFDLIPRNSERTLRIGGDTILFGNVASAPNCSDLDRGRRVGDRESYRDLLKLTQYFNCIHMMAGYPVEPLDIHPSIRHLDCIYDALTLCDKPVHAYSLGKERIEDAMEMVRIAAGISQEEFESAPRIFTNINSTSPLKHDTFMLDGAMRMARLGQAVIITPFTLAGAMAPATIVGAVVQQTAEALAAVALLQVVRPGAPVVLGSFTSNVDMSSGAPAFGTPEYMRATQISGQMARFYNLPYRASNACAANYPDAQAAWESAFSLWACVTSGVNIVYHAAGWLEGGLCAGYEKFVMDCETLQQVMHYMQQVTASADDLAVDAIREVGPNGNFFSAAHTLERYETAFYSPFLSDWRNFEAWEEQGSVATPERANGVWKKILNEFESPAMDAGAKEELEAFVSRRKEEGGAPTDY
jgi:trimethylamine--corrinoid protein Co-methyltransferase